MAKNTTKTAITYKQVARFCDEHLMRYALSEPWINKGVAVATNGRALVEIYDPQFVPPETEGRKPNYEELFDLFAHPDLDWHQLPDKTCSECTNGLIGRTCETCMGLRFVVCNFDHQHDCESCEDGVEYESCCQVELAKLPFSERWLNPFRQFEAVEFAKADEGSIFLRFDGGRGKLMAALPQGCNGQTH